MRPRQGTALILGVSGQDGAYLADLLVRRGLTVHGTSRDKDAADLSSLRRLGIHDRVTCHSATPGDFRSVVAVLNAVRPALIFNLAAQSSVGRSFEQPVETIDGIMNGAVNVMEAVRVLGLDARFFNAGSSECFGDTAGQPAGETTAFAPRSPYAVAKAAAFWAVANYREAYGLFACTGVLFNHESPLRPARYVTQKIVRGAVAIAHGRGDTIDIGKLDIARDWGWAPEYVDAMARMLDLDTPQDFVIATGETRTLEDFVAAAFAAVGLNWRDHVVENPALHRPVDIGHSSGDPAKAARLLGWQAGKRMTDVVTALVDAELRRCAEGAGTPDAAAEREAARTG